MKATNINIDINKLNTEELEMIQKLLYQYDESNDNYKKVSTRLSFLNGCMSEKQEQEYLNEIL